MKRKIRSILSSIFVGLTLVHGMSALGQNTSPADQKSAPRSLVTLHLIVTDKNNHSLDEINKEAVQVFEAKTLQTIMRFEVNEGPTDYALVIDNSGSLRSTMGSLFETARTLLQNKRPSDEVFIERFVSRDKISTVQEFTANRGALLASLRLLRTEAGQSAVIDGLYFAVDHTAKHGLKEPRKAVVLITDGEDRASFYSIEKLVQLLHETNVKVFIIGFVNNLDEDGGLIRKSPRLKAEKLLTVIAEESGGRLFLPKNAEELTKAIAEIVHDLGRQFAISYQPVGDGGEAGFRKVEVKLLREPKAEKLRIIAPRGYYVNTSGSTSKP